MKEQSEKFAITGYVAKDIAGRLKAQAAGAIHVSPERGQTDVVMGVDGSAVAEVRIGATVKGQTLVQLILKEGAAVETIIRSKANIAGITRLNDPAIQRLTAAATVKSIVA